MVQSCAESVDTRFAALDIVRGLAALWVFAFHAAYEPTFQQTLPWLHDLARIGWLGLWAFFVVSGYCLVASLRRSLAGHESTGRFLLRRVVRIYPPFLISILICVAVPYVLELMSMARTGQFIVPATRFDHWQAIDWVGLATLTRVFWGEGEDLQSRFTAVNAVYWTLAIEMQFYLVMAAAHACRRYWPWVIAGVTAASLLVILNGWWTTSGLFLSFWPTFALGIGLHEVVRRTANVQQRIGHVARLSLAVGVLLLTACVMRYATTGYLGIHVIFVSGLGLLLWCIQPWDTYLRRSLERGPVLRVGLLKGLMILGSMSYTLYLLHGKLRWVTHAGLRQIMSPETFGFGVLVIAVTTVMVWPIYLLMEKPFSRLSQSLSRRNRRVIHHSYPLDHASAKPQAA